MSIPNVDFPTAWAIARRTPPEQHQDGCAFRVTRGAVLCDCDVLRRSPEVLKTKGLGR